MNEYNVCCPFCILRHLEEVVIIKLECELTVDSIKTIKLCSQQTLIAFYRRYKIHFCDQNYKNNSYNDTVILKS